MNKSQLLNELKSFLTNDYNIIMIDGPWGSGKTYLLNEFINLKENEIKDPENRIRDVTNIGHHGVGNYELRITTEDDFYYFNMLFKQSYNEKI